jgi:type II secretory pathway component PulM
VNSARLPLRWQLWSLRERVLVALAAIVVIVGAGWPLLWAPIERDVERSASALARAHADAAKARRLGDEAIALEREAAPARTADARKAFESVAAASGVRDRLTALEASDGRVRATFGSIDLVTLAAFVDALGREERLFVRDALLAAQVDAGTVRAELTLARDPR